MKGLKRIFLLTGGCLLTGSVFAQTPILKDVTIEYEKKVNTWATVPENFRDRVRQNTAQYASTFFSYETDGTRSVYKMIPDKNGNAQAGRGSFRRINQNENDEIYTDFVTEEQISLKSIFEKTYLLTDSINHFQWKLTNDFREIAGFNCRRATTIIMDSVFVVAFYTNEIIAQGGPESFTGLPGTILGLVINRLHTTWYATKVSVVDVDPSKLIPPSDPKAEKSDKKELFKSLRDRFQNNSNGRFGTGDQLIWSLMI